MKYWLLGAAFVAFIVNRGQRLADLMTKYEGIIYNDDDCILKGEMLGTEDMGLGKHSVLFFGNGDLKGAFGEGSAKAEPGGIWALNMAKAKSSEPIPVPIKGFTSERFQVHGIYVSNKTDRIYAVNHIGHKSVVEILKIEYDTKCLGAGWKCASPVSLTHYKTISSPLMPNYGLNDVVEGIDGTELYVTFWKSLPSPEFGTNHQSTTDKIYTTLNYIIGIIGLRTTGVYRCDIEKNECARASPLFIASNGITVSEDRQTFFVSDPSDKSVTILKRETDGSLTYTSKVKLPYPVDNVEYNPETGDIYMGSIPDIPAILRKESTGDESINVPGGCTILKKDGESWKIDEVLFHDGSQLSQIAASYKMGNTVVLGSPFSAGILVCSI